VKLVVIESPYAGDVEKNLRYVRACMKDCLYRGEAPYASHALYTQLGVLDDQVPDQRRRGIEAGFAWRNVAELVVFYEDLGWSRGMEAARTKLIEDNLVRTGMPMFWEIRKLAGWRG
jgi:hypothetical protein